MKTYCFLILLALLGCKETNTLTSQQIIEKSISFHDPNKNIKDLNFKVRVQEPRLRNPERYSIVKLNNKTGNFELQRNRDSHISSHKIDKNGIAYTLLDNKIVTDSVLIKKYRLDPKRNLNYRKYYQVFSLFPMSLHTINYQVKENFTEEIFNNKLAYKLKIELDNPVFSEHWYLYFNNTDFKFLGGQIIYPEKPNEGEKIIFEGIINIDEVKVARFHHWYDLQNTYLGSDVFVSEIK